MRKELLLLAIFAMPTSTVGLAQEISVDDFLPAVEGGKTSLELPSKVKIKADEDTVEAATAQDAVNAAVQLNKTEVAKEGPDETKPQHGVKMVVFPSGLGYVATGAASYRVVENPVATRISQRNAVIVAFTEAKKLLAVKLKGMSNEGKDTIRKALANVETKDQSLTNFSEQTESSVEQSVEALLRGFVVHEVYDDAKNNTVFVSIVTTPKTRGKLARPAPNQIEAESLRDGVNKMLIQVKSGLVPPVGGGVVTVPTTGETAFIGFGSTVVRENDNSAVQAKLNVNALRTASAYASDSLCGLIIGDQTAWQGKTLESHKDEHKEFEESGKDDPLNPNSQEQKKLDAVREAFVAKMEMTDIYTSARKGVLPPGIEVKTWFDEDNTWAYGMAIYIPSATNLAAGVAKEMDEAKILQDINPITQSKDGKEGKVGTIDDRNIQRPSKSVKPLSSGKSKDDL
jgi:hypothetical protein